MAVVDSNKEAVRETVKLSERYIQKQLYRALYANQLVMPNFTPGGWWECDMWVLTKSGYAREYEIKLTVADFKADVKKRKMVCFRKHLGYREHSKHDLLDKGCEFGPVQFWYVIPKGMLDGIGIPIWAGLIEVYPDGGLSHRSTGPRLHKKKVEQSVIDQAHTSLYYRFWTERLKNT